jgi:hypothetical protein
VLRIISGPKLGEEARWWRKPHDNEIHNVLFAKHEYEKIKGDQIGKACSTYERE